MSNPEAAGGVARVLLALEPQMYGEAIAASLLRSRPDLRLVLSAVEDLRDEAGRLGPDLVVATWVPLSLKRSGVYWVEVSLNGKLGGQISADGYSREVEELSLADLLEAVDRAADRTLGS